MRMYGNDECKIFPIFLELLFLENNLKYSQKDVTYFYGKKHVRKNKCSLKNWFPAFGMKRSRNFHPFCKVKWLQGFLFFRWTSWNSFEHQKVAFECSCGSSRCTWWDSNSSMHYAHIPRFLLLYDAPPESIGVPVLQAGTWVPHWYLYGKCLGLAS